MSAPASKKPVAKVAAKEIQAKENMSLEFMPMEMSYGFMQLKPCACGGGCPRCAGNKNNNRRMLQAKLQIGAAHDVYEQEADRVADQVLAMPVQNGISKGTPPRIQRLTNSTQTPVNAVPPSVDRVLSESGRSLEPGLQQDMEQRFGHDFSQVKIHTNTTAAQSATDVSAHAYTVGNNIVFAPGQFSPTSQQGKRLLAHELTHVVQQSGNRALGIQRYIDVDVLTTQVTDDQAQAMTDAELEREIDRLREYLSTLARTSAAYAGAIENLHTLEAALTSRNPLPAPRRSRARATTSTTSPTVSISDAVRSQPEAWEEARRMTPDELTTEITRIREVMIAGGEDSVENEVNQERLNIFERELESRDALMLGYADVMSDPHGRSRLGIDGAFFTGFLTAALSQIPEGEVRDFFDHDVRDHPGEFIDGIDEGIPRGVIEGAQNLVDTFVSIGEFIVRALMAAVEHSDTISQLAEDAIHTLAYEFLEEDTYTRYVERGIIADSGYLERRRGYERRAELIRDELQNFSRELASDPTIVIRWSGDLGTRLGDAVGRSVTEGFLRATPREQGVIVGRVLGQIIFEIIVQLVLAAVTEGAGNVARAGTGLLRGFVITEELANLLREMASASAAVRRLIRIAETGEEVVDTVVDTARIVETGEEILDTTADTARIVETAGDLPSRGGTGALDSVVEEARVPGARTADPEVSGPREPSIDTETPRAEGARTAEPEGDTPAESLSDTETSSADSAPESAPVPAAHQPLTVEAMEAMGIRTEAVQVLDAAGFSSVELRPGQQALYILLDEEGAILKVGRTSEGAARGRFSVYRRAGASRVEVYPLEGEVTEAMATRSETMLRTRLEAEGHEMPWDNTGGRLGREGFGTPGEGVRVSPVSRERMIELLTLHHGNRRAVAAALAEELGRDSVHPRTIGMWAQSLGIRTMDYR